MLAKLRCGVRLHVLAESKVEHPLFEEGCRFERTEEKMNLVYVDEQEVEGARGPYTAVVGALISANQINSFRKKFFSEGLDLLGLGSVSDGTRVIANFPLVHGRNLLPGFEDEKKVQVCRLLLNCFSSNGGRFLRLGYYNKSLPKSFPGIRAYRIHFAVSSMMLSFEKSEEPYCFLHENDPSFAKADLPFFSGQMSIYYQLSAENVSFDYQKYIGSFIAPKYDLGCQVADIAGYVAMKAESAKTDFSRALADVYREEEGNYLLNRIIWMNDGR